MPRKKRVKLHASEVVDLDTLKEHPRNYRNHPEDQIEHLMQSMREQGFYRNVVVAKDGTILAGHGVTIAARRLGLDQVSVVRLNISPSSAQALKLLAGDNYLGGMAEDRMDELAELLTEVDTSSDLLGTGFDEVSLGALLDRFGGAEPFDAMAEWEGMPEYRRGSTKSTAQVTIHFDTHEAADEFFELIDRPRRLIMWWPTDDGRKGMNASKGVVAE